MYLPGRHGFASSTRAASSGVTPSCYILDMERGPEDEDAARSGAADPSRVSDSRAMKSAQRTEKVAAAFDRIALALSSLTPLAALLALRFAGPDWKIFAAFVVIVALGLLATGYFVFRATGTESFSPVVARVDDAGPEAAAYLVSFVFPFLVVQQDAGWQDVAMYVAFVVVYILVLSGTNMIAVNPLFYLIGLRVWRVESGDLEHRTALLIGRVRPTVGLPHTMSGRHGIYLSAKEQSA